MKCPYCEKEMILGYIQCRDGVYWTLKKQLVASLSSLGKGSTCLSNGAADNSSTVFGDYYGYRIENRTVLPSPIYIWEHETFKAKVVANNLIEMIELYYRDKI